MFIWRKHVYKLIPNLPSLTILCIEQEELKWSNWFIGDGDCHCVRVSSSELTSSVSSCERGSSQWLSLCQSLILRVLVWEGELLASALARSDWLLFPPGATGARQSPELSLCWPLIGCQAQFPASDWLAAPWSPGPASGSRSSLHQWPSCTLQLLSTSKIFLTRLIN